MSIISELSISTILIFGFIICSFTISHVPDNILFRMSYALSALSSLQQYYCFLFCLFVYTVCLNRFFLCQIVCYVMINFFHFLLLFFFFFFFIIIRGILFGFCILPEIISEYVFLLVIIPVLSFFFHSSFSLI